MPEANFDRIARPYRWLEYCSFGPMLERCRFHRVPQLTAARQALVLGDGDGRFLARLLRDNPYLKAHAVDQSFAMQSLLLARVAAAGATDRVTTQQADARTFQPQGAYDLVTTHFFLDCFTEEELQVILVKIRPHMSQDAIWVVSEFSIPAGLAGYPAKLIVTMLYAAFRFTTGLKVRSLPKYADVFTERGLVLYERKTFLAGLLVSDLWRFPAAGSPASR